MPYMMDSFAYKPVVKNKQQPLNYIHAYVG
jgi:hypothetical protein